MDILLCTAPRIFANLNSILPLFQHSCALVWDCYGLFDFTKDIVYDKLKTIEI